MTDRVAALVEAQPPDHVANVEGSAESIGMAILVHELAGPVTLLAGFAEVLATTTDPEVRARSLEPVRRATRRARAALALVSDVSALDAGRLAVDRATIDLRNMVDEALELVDGAGARCRVEVDQIVFEGDADRLVIVVSNLIGNAMKHTPAGSSISVRGAIEGDSAVLHVIDDGPGIPPDQAAFVFRRFGRLQGKTAGTGLGLYLARGIVRAHGGELTYRAAPRGGAEFVVELPLLAHAGTSPHAVHIYDDDAQLVHWVADAFAAAAVAGRATLMVATPAHRETIEQELRSRGVPLDRQIHRSLDAGTTLDSLLTDGHPDPVLFDQMVAPLVAELSHGGHGLTVFGEMVDLLWDRGHATAAMALESSWNTLGTKLDFSLLCAYKATPDADLSSFDCVTALHTQVLHSTA